MRAQIARLLVEMSEDPALRERLDEGLFERFVAVRDSDYDDIRAMLRLTAEMGMHVLR